MQVARAVACRARLRILSRLARQEEVAPTALAAELKMPLPVVCVHLRRLSSAGLIQRRRSAAWCYGVARSPYGPQTFSGRVASWLFELLRNPENSLRQCGDDAARKPGAATAELRLHDLLFEAATAFANVRRLQILRRLAERGPSDGADLCGALKMSPAALSRHGSKLMRRGYVTAQRHGGGLRYELARTSKTLLHGRLLELVRTEWRK